MRKPGISPAMFAASFIGSAHAQSSVKLYGIADAGMAHTSILGGHTEWRLINVNDPGVGISGAAHADGDYGPLRTIPAGHVARQTIYGGGAAYAFGSLAVTAIYPHVRFEATTGGDLTFARFDQP